VEDALKGRAWKSLTFTGRGRDPHPGFLSPKEREWTYEKGRGADAPCPPPSMMGRKKRGLPVGKDRKKEKLSAEGRGGRGGTFIPQRQKERKRK